jgi:cation:H+ antiporter
VNLLSAWRGTTDLAIANIVGSNLANILLILGAGAAIKTLEVKKGTTYKEIPFALLGSVLVLVMGNDSFLNGPGLDVLSRTDGIVFLSFFVIFLYYTYGMSKVSGEESTVSEYSWGKSALFFLIGITGLVFGGQLIVNNAITLATLAGMSEALIGLTIVAIGTSLPELATTVVAIKNGQTDLAIGNAIGSNVFNVFWILGLSSFIQPLPFSSETNMDVIMACIATLMLFGFMFLGKHHKLERWQGVLFLCMYIGYLAFAVVR